MSESIQSSRSGGGMAKVVYLLYLASLIFGITGLVGVVMAYINRDGAPEWLQSHYQFQIRTFWIGLLLMIVGFFSMIFLVGYLILLFWAIWLIVRCIKGIKYLDKKEAHPDPTTWML